MKVLVTGANGFIGQRLCTVLATQNFSVRASLHSANTRLGILPGIEQIVVGDIGPKTNWKDALAGVNTVVHLAARVHIIKEEVANPLTAFQLVNVKGTLRLAQQAAAEGVKRFIFISSIKVNGEQTEENHPFKEKDTPAPVGPYALSKFEAEQRLKELAEKSDMNIVIIRPPLIYGPDAKGNFIKMMEWIYKGIPLPFGAIKNKRSLIGLDNLVNLIILCIHHPAAANQVFLAADGEDVSTTTLLKCLGNKMGSPTMLIPIPQKLLEAGLGRIGKKDIACKLCGSLQVDNSKAKILLGWQPIMSLEQGLIQATEWFLDNY